MLLVDPAVRGGANGFGRIAAGVVACSWPIDIIYQLHVAKKRANDAGFAFMVGGGNRLFCRHADLQLFDFSKYRSIQTANDLSARFAANQDCFDSDRRYRG